MNEEDFAQIFLPKGHSIKVDSILPGSLNIIEYDGDLDWTTTTRHWTPWAYQINWLMEMYK